VSLNNRTPDLSSAKAAESLNRSQSQSHEKTATRANFSWLRRHGQIGTK
jgi:hypothetical protein